MTGEGSHEQTGPHRIGLLNVLRKDVQRAWAEVPPPGLEHFRALGLRNPALTTPAEPEEFSPSFVQKIIDGDRFRTGILESERMSARALGVAVVVAYAHTVGFMDEIKGRIGN